MKAGIHPEYKEVVFQDISSDFAFLTRSTIGSKETIKWEDGNEYPLVKVEISSDGGVSWTELTRFDGPADDTQAQFYNADISAYASANTVIRFLGSSFSLDFTFDFLLEFT